MSDRNDIQSFGNESKMLAIKLSLSDNVNRFDEADEKAAWTMAHSFLDIEGSFENFKKMLGRLRNEELTDEQVNDLLVLIGEEFRHIEYHIKDMKYYNYL